MGDGLVVLFVILALAIAAWALSYQVGIEDGPYAYKTFRDEAADTGSAQIL